MQVLVADDEPVAREELRACLERLGYEVEAARDGLEAWERLSSEKVYAVALLECDMPGLTGMALARRIRDSSSPTHRQLVVLLMSANASGNRVLECLEAGADDVVAKPWDPRELAGRLRVAERQRERLIELDKELLRVRAMTQMLDDLLECRTVCSYCKCIRNDEGEWSEPERFLGERAPLQITHGVCPDCIFQLTARPTEGGARAPVGRWG